VVVRLPIGQSYYTTYAKAPQYRQGIATIMATAKSLGMYVILELHGYDAQNLNEAQPDPSSTPPFWAQVAQQFGSEPHVLFDIWNEPHSVSWSTWKANAEKIIETKLRTRTSIALKVCIEHSPMRAANGSIG
jgi:aryl-phospho-beta-D-glucosidase BglC (GH1 family)